VHESTRGGLRGRATERTSRQKLQSPRMRENREGTIGRDPSRQQLNIDGISVSRKGGLTKSYGCSSLLFLDTGRWGSKMEVGTCKLRYVGDMGHQGGGFRVSA